MILATDIKEFMIPFLIVASFIIFGFLSYYLGRKRIVIRKLSKFKFKNVSQFKSNELTKITGKVLHVHEPFVAPFSKRKCVAYLIKIQQKVSSGKKFSLENIG